MGPPHTSIPEPVPHRLSVSVEILCHSCWDHHHPEKQWSPTFLEPGTCFMGDNFFTDGWWGWFRDGSSALHLLCTLFLLFLLFYLLLLYYAIYDEIIIQLIVMQDQWGPELPATRWFHLWVKGEQWEAAVNTGELLLACLSLTFCCVAWFLTGH